MGEPLGHPRRLMSGWNVQDHMRFEVSGHVHVDQLEEREHVLGAVALASVVGGVSKDQIERSRLISGAAPVVVSHRQARLSRNQYPTLRFLVNGENCGPCWRVSIQPDDVDQPLLEVGIAKDLQPAYHPRSEPTATPDPRYRDLTDPESLRYPPSALARRAVIGSILERCPHQLRHRALSQPRLAASPRCDRASLRYSRSLEALPPHPHRVISATGHTRHLIGGNPLCGQQQRLGLNHRLTGSELEWEIRPKDSV